MTDEQPAGGDEALRERVYHAAENLLDALSLTPTAYPVKLNKHTDAVMEIVDAERTKAMEYVRHERHDAEFAPGCSLCDAERWDAVERSYARADKDNSA